MKTVRTNRHASHFDRLEPRQHMAIDLSASTAVPAGAYGEDDLFDIKVTLTNSASGSSQVPTYVTVVLSKDKKLGNDDDISLGGSIFLDVKGKKSATNTEQVDVNGIWAAGDYYVATTADPYGSHVYEESNTKNNTTWSAKKDIRIVTDKIGGDGVIRGTPKNDTITVQHNFANEIVTLNGHSYRFDTAEHLSPLSIQAGKGNDKITVDPASNLPHILSGNAGNDTITGGNGGDTIWGDAGNDRIYAGKGLDTIHGGSGNDIIDGGAGKDSIFADGGKDKVKNSSEDIFASAEIKY